MKVVLAAGKATLQTRTTPLALNMARLLEGRRIWLKGGGLSFEATGHNMAIVREHYPDLVVEDPNATAAEFDLPTSASPQSYTPKTKPFMHQDEALKKVRTKPHFALFMEQGTGKSKVAIDRAGELFCQRKITGMLIISKKGPHEQWVLSQMPIHCGVPFTAAYLRQKEKVDLSPDSSTLKAFSLNHEALRTDKGMQAVNKFIEMHNGRVLCVLDEGHVASNYRAATTKLLKVIGRQCAFRMELTGTPVPHNLTNEWSQLDWVDPSILGIKYITSFRNEYCRMGGFEGREIISYKNIEQFRQKVDPYTFRVRRVDIGLMPPVYDPIIFELLPEQKRIIKEIKQELQATVQAGTIEISEQVVATMRIQQVSNGFIQEKDGTVHRLFDDQRDNPRIIRLMEMQEGIKKLIIWARFREDISIIKQVLEAEFGKGSSVFYHGGIGDRERRDAISSFLDKDGARFFVSNPQAGGTGLNLQGLCTDDVFYSNSDAWVDRIQAEARIDRIGTQGFVTHHDLLCRGAQDFKIRGRHKRKESVQSMAVDDFINWLNADDDMDDIDFSGTQDTSKETFSDCSDAIWDEFKNGKQEFVPSAGDWE